MLEVVPAGINILKFDVLLQVDFMNIYTLNLSLGRAS